MEVFHHKKTFLTVYTIYTLIFMFQFNNVSAATHTLTLTSSGSQSINVSASSGTAISSDSINVATTCRYGYNFTINTSVNDNNLYLNGNSSNNASGTYFSPVDGTSALNAVENKWGYYYNSSALNTPTNTSVFSPVPTLSNPATVRTPLVNPSSSNINDNFKIYYGVNSAPSMSVGTYKMTPDTNNSNNDGTIVYTATIADACLGYTVRFSPTSIFEGSALSGTDTMADQMIYEGITTPLTNNSFTAPSGYYFTGWNTAQDGTGASYTNQQSVTDLTNTGNTITLYAQWTDCPPNTICYSANVTNPNDIEGEMGDQTISSTDTSTVLYAPNFKRANYGFASWNTNPGGTGTNYGPNQTLSFEANQYQNYGLKLYANWVANANNMQNWTGCSGMNIGDITALKDTRDNDVYAVAKLADGKCWMIENLRLDDSATLSTTNTHNPALPITNNNGTTSNHLSPTTDPTQTAWCMTDSSACIDQSLITTNNTVFFTNNTASNYSADSDVYSYGNYYDWYSATAGHGKNEMSTNNQSTGGDICPTGWHLPRGGNKNNENNNEFWRLIVTGINNGINPVNYDYYSQPYYTGDPEGVNVSKALRSYPNNFVYSGAVAGSSFLNRTVYGCYWSATVYNGVDTYYMNFSNDYADPATDHRRKYAGWTMRCVSGT